MASAYSCSSGCKKSFHKGLNRRGIWRGRLFSDKMMDMEDEKEEPYIAKTACGGKLKDLAGYPSAMYRAERVYFCTKACSTRSSESPRVSAVESSSRMRSE